MSKESDLTKLTRARNLVAGLRKAFAPGDVFMIRGVRYTRDEAIAFFESHIEALLAKKHKYAAYRDAVARERKVAKQALYLWLSLQRQFQITQGPSGPPRFGMKARKKPGPKTTAAKLAGVQKRAKKRAPK